MVVALVGAFFGGFGGFFGCGERAGGVLGGVGSVGGWGSRKQALAPARGAVTCTAGAACRAGAACLGAGWGCGCGVARSVSQQRASGPLAWVWSGGLAYVDWQAAWSGAGSAVPGFEGPRPGTGTGTIPELTSPGLGVVRGAGMRLAGGAWSGAGSHGPWVRGAAPRDWDDPRTHVPCVVCGNRMRWGVRTVRVWGVRHRIHRAHPQSRIHRAHTQSAYTERIHRAHTQSAYTEPHGVEVRDRAGSVVKGRPPGVEVRVGTERMAGWGRGPQVRGQVRDRLGWRSVWVGPRWLGWGSVVKGQPTGGGVRGGRSAGVGVRPPRTAVCGGSEGSGSVRGVEVRVWPRV